MGYENFIVRAKRMNKKVVPEDLRNLDAYYSYIGNEWVLNRYSSWEEYSKNYYYDGRSIPEPSKEMIDFYQNEDDRYYFMETWCSSGRYFADEMNRLTKNGQEELDRDKIVQMMNYCQEIIDDSSLIPVIVNRAFREDDDAVITSIPCDGLEVEDEEGHIKRIYTSDWELSEIFIPKKYYNQEKLDAITRLNRCLNNILLTADFEKEIYFFEESY